MIQTSMSMRIVDTLDSFPPSPGPIVLTIGFFDGVHRGHQHLLHRLRNPAVALTFPDHPAHLLRPQTHIPLINSPAYKAELLGRYGVDTVVLLPFTPNLASQTPETFLTTLRIHIPFSHLVLGHDAHLGRHRSGTPDVIRALARKHHFTVEYCPPFNLNGRPVSSSRVRTAIQSGDLITTEQLLGRQLSYESIVQHGEGLGGKLGYPTANLSVQGTCLPPNGVYAVLVNLRHHSLPGIANLGIAPTLHAHRERLLEVHIFDLNQNLYGETVEVVIHTHIRPERKFESADALRTQIGKDVLQAQALLGSV
jgi:riboflavin kinase / FMN adenylyltransferase